LRVGKIMFTVPLCTAHIIFLARRVLTLVASVWFLGADYGLATIL
jgi:hypothetical protein